MTLELVALSVVADVARHSKATFVNGTMFVENIDKVDASRILNNLRHYVYLDTIMSETEYEFAYDFC